MKKKAIIDQWITRVIPCACATKGTHNVKMGFAANVLRHISTDCDAHWDAACTATELGNKTCVTFVKELHNSLHGDDRPHYGVAAANTYNAVKRAFDALVPHERMQYTQYSDLTDNRATRKKVEEMSRVVTRDSVLCRALVAYTQTTFKLQSRKISATIVVAEGAEFLEMCNNGRVYRILYRPLGVKRWRINSARFDSFFETNRCDCTVCELERHSRNGHSETAGHIKKYKKALEDICAYANLPICALFKAVGVHRPSESLLKFQQVCKQYENR